jgi:asparagine synthetase B (glutamine-hydrolysing)
VCRGQGGIRVNSQEKQYFTLGKLKSENSIDKERSNYIPFLKEALKRAVEKHIKKEDPKIACLLSGGVDSSITTYLAT